MGSIARNNFIAYGIAVHSRFHQFCAMHNNTVAKNYKIYSYLQAFIFSMVAIVFISWFSNIQITASTEWIVGTLLIVILAVTIAFFEVDCLLRSNSSTLTKCHTIFLTDFYNSEKRYRSESSS